MNRRMLAVATCGAGLALGVSACGDDDEEPAAASGAAASEQRAPAQESGGQDIVALAQSNPNLTTLVDAVTAADLGPTLQGKGPYTVFAPTNEAFDAVGQKTLDELLKPENKEQLTDILTYHVVEGELKAADLKDGQQLKTVQGGEVEVALDGDTVTVGDAKVAQADVDASNGVVHAIDGVLMP